MEEIKKLGLQARGYQADQYFLTNILVDTVRGKDKLASAVPAFLEYANIPYTGCGSNRHLFKEALEANNIPTPAYKFVRWSRS